MRLQQRFEMYPFILTLAALLVLALAPAATRAQGTSAQLSGRVTDGSGANVPDAMVVVTNRGTQVKSQTMSNRDGLYTIPQLSPGLYDITISKGGFATVTRAGVTLVVDQTAQLNFSLQIGAVDQTVVVTGEEPLLATDNPTSGQVIAEQQIVGLPLNGRSPFRLVLLTPGIHSVPSTSGQFGDIPVNTTDDTLISIDGGPASANEIMIDGIPTTTGFINQMTTIPSVDATQEFDVQSGPLKAEWGHTGGGVINVFTKSGTNRIHGGVYEFLRNSALNANEYFNKAGGKPTPEFQMNQFGMTAGGPVVIPHIYNGRDKTFFFVDYQGTRWRQGQIYRATLPTALERGGDFSNTTVSVNQVATPIRIFNPFSTRQDPTKPAGNYIRDEFNSEKIDPSLLNPVALAALQYVPLPNLPGFINNYISNAKRTINEAEFGVKMDESIGTREKLFERFSFNRNTLGQPDTYANVADADTGALGKLYLNNYSAGINSTTTLSSSMVLSASYGFARFYWARPTRSLGFDQTSLGLPSSLVAQQAYKLFPSFTIANYTGIGGGNALLFTGQNTHSLLVSLIATKGRHTVKFGFDGRLQLFNQVQGGDANGTYSFSQSLTAGPNATATGTAIGDAFASFLLGTPSSGQMGLPAGFSLKSVYLAGFAQDDFRLTPTLSISYGVRYEATSPMSERRNELNYFDTGIASPAANTTFPALKGGLVFANASNRYVYSWMAHDLQPRFGFSYNPLKNTVIRGGVGLVYMPLSLNPPGDGIGAAPTSGFSSETPMAAVQSGVIPVNTLSNPYPNGLVKPVGSSQGAATSLGQPLSVWRRNPAQPNEWQWNFGVQQQWRNVLFDALYEGSKGTHLVRTLPINALPTANFALGSALQAQVTNPFFGTITTGNLALAKIAQQQLLLPYPQFGAITVLDDTSGSSNYHAFTAKINAPFKHGLTFLAAYTFSKELADVPNSLTTYNNASNSPLNTSIQDPYNLRAEYSLVETDVPQQLSVNGVAELPFGKNHAWGGGANPVVRELISGWQTNGILQFRRGYPLVMMATINDGGNRPNKVCSGKLYRSASHAQEIAKWFDTSCYVQPPAFTFGNDSRTEGNLRGPNFTQIDFGIEKHDHFFGLDSVVRAEAFNLFNAAHFYEPVTNVSSPAFGQIQSTTGTPRVIQLALKLNF